jgi:CBS domain-containing membrane protein
MFALRCVHPPSGAVALTAVLGGPAIHAMGYSFILEPIAVQSFALLTAAIVFHSLTGHRYPHVGTQNPTQGATASMAMPSGFTRGGLEAMLGRRSEWLDIDTDDLQSLLRETQLQGYVRVFSELTCANIMSQPPISVPASMKAEAAQRLLRRHGLKAMLVTDPANQVIGRVALADLARLGGVAKLGVLIHRLWPIVRRSSTSMHVVEAVMTTGLCVTADSTPIADLVPLFANDEHSSIPVLDGSRQLVGLITPTDLISGLYRQAQAAQY